MPNDEWTSLSRKKKHTGMTPEQIVAAQEILSRQAAIAASLKKSPTVIAKPAKSVFFSFHDKKQMRNPPKSGQQKKRTSESREKFYDKYKNNTKLWTNEKDK